MNQIAFYEFEKHNLPVAEWDGERVLCDAALADSLKTTTKALNQLAKTHASEVNPIKINLTEQPEYKEIAKVMGASRYSNWLTLYSVRDAQILAMLTESPVGERFRAWIVDVVLKANQPAPAPSEEVTALIRTVSTVLATMQTMVAQQSTRLDRLEDRMLPALPGPAATPEPKKAPKGWLRTGQLAVDWNMDDITPINLVTAAIREECGGDFGEKFPSDSRIGGMTYYYSPSDQKLIATHLRDMGYRIRNVSRI